MDTRAAAVAERTELAELLETLDEREWSSPSLCIGWSVRDVVAHVVSYEGRGPADLARLAVRGRLRPDRMNAVAQADLAGLRTDELVALVRRYAEPAGLTAAMGGSVALVDTLVHQQDVRRPLGRPRDIPSDRLRHALGVAWTAPVVRGLWNCRGVRVVADDVDWARGRGPEARGPAEAVLMAVAGRRGVAAELSGPGAATLRSRLG